jgi:hypothetical protein
MYYIKNIYIYINNLSNLYFYVKFKSSLIVLKKLQIFANSLGTREGG